MRFSEEARSMLRQCYTTTSFSILVEGEPTQMFKSKLVWTLSNSVQSHHGISNPNHKELNGLLQVMYEQGGVEGHSINTNKRVFN